MRLCVHMLKNCVTLTLARLVDEYHLKAVVATVEANVAYIKTKFES